jgi:hypothetical protein
MLEYSVIIGALINFLGTLPYIRDTLAGSTKPNRVTFLLWATAPLIGAAASFASGVRWAILPVLMSGLCPALVLLASFYNKKAYWKIRPFDYACGFFSILGLILWRITNQPDVALFLSVVTDFLAALPTIRKSWTYPETETASSYAASFIGALTCFFVIKDISFSACAFPTYLLSTNAVILFALWRKKLAKFVGLKI